MLMLSTGFLVTLTALSALLGLSAALSLSGAAAHTGAIITHGFQEVGGLVLGRVGMSERIARGVAHDFTKGRIRAGRRDTGGGGDGTAFSNRSHTTGLGGQGSGHGLRRAGTYGKRGIDLAELIITEVEAITTGSTATTGHGKTATASTTLASLVLLSLVSLALPSLSSLAANVWRDSVVPPRAVRIDR